MLRLKWTRLAVARSDALHRSSHSLAVLGSKAYIFGGENKPRTPVDDLLYIVDLHDGSITVSASPLRPSARVGAVLTADKSRNLLYLWGGRQSKEMTPCDASLWVYDVASGIWTQVPPAVGDAAQYEIPAERSYHCMAVLGDKLFLHAGCPAQGRSAQLHSLTLPPSSESRWSSLPAAPEPGRGGTVLCPLTLPLNSSSSAGQEVLVRYGGFAGHELGASIDVYSVSQSSWSTLPLPATGDGTPEARSVHALIPLPRTHTANPQQRARTVALMLFGERDPAPVELGHNGAGKFHSDVWALRYTPCSTTDDDEETQRSDLAAGFSFERVHISHLDSAEDEAGTPEARGWFSADVWEGADGVARAVVYGGLNGKNERLGDVWVGAMSED